MESRCMRSRTSPRRDFSGNPPRTILSCSMFSDTRQQTCLSDPGHSKPQIPGDVFILLCDGRIVFCDEGAVLHERIRNILPAPPKIVVNLNGVDYIDSGGLGILVGLLVSASKRGGEIKLVSPSKRVKDL